jgi:hypothetical protein
MTEPPRRRRPGYDDYAHFPSRRPNNCGRCGASIALGDPVLGKPLDGRRWDIVCLSCGYFASDDRTTARGTARRARQSSGDSEHVESSSAHGQRVSGGGPAPLQWSTLVGYLLSCVQRESLVAPIPLNDRERWAVLPLSAETALCGNDLSLPLLEQLQELFADLNEMEGVFYGWPTVVVEDDRGRPFVAPLFVRELAKPNLGGGVNGDPFVPVSESLPQVNMGLLTTNWFSPELIASAAAVVAQTPVGFGLASAMVSVTQRLAAALGLPGGLLDPRALVEPGTLGDPWRPQEVGVFNLAIAFKGELDVATRNLIKDLEWMRGATDWRDSAARFLFETATPPAASLPASCAIKLNDSQETALASAATAPLTVITGPPGTGKSQTVAAIVADAWLRGEKVLITSTNNTPIDDVINDKMLPLDEALILRTGNADKRRELGAWLRQLVRRVPQRPREAVMLSLPEVSLTRHRAARILEDRARRDRAVLLTAERRDRARELVWRDQQPPSHDLVRIRFLAEKACRTRWRWLKRRRTEACLVRAGIQDPSITAEQVRDWLTAEDSFRAAWRELTTMQLAHSVDAVASFAEAEDNWLVASRATTRARVREQFTAGAEALNQLADVLTDELPRREAIERAMVYVRGWATSALSTRPNFECRAGVIDLIVIDEASQCNLAAVLPLAYRARRLVIVGDPKQLPPVVTANAQELRSLAVLANTTHDVLASTHLTYEDSAYTAFAPRHGRDSFLLDEHYRCHPEIIQFCNKHFYDNRLTVLTKVGSSRDRPHGLEWREVAGRTERGRAGSAVNRAEAEAVAEWVTECGLPSHSVGVVTPFREQARLIRQLLSSQQGRTSFKEVRVGTAHTFQGGECKTMLFSTVLSVGANPGTVAWLEGERNLINVAVSRAREHLVVFGNREELRRLGATTLLALAEATERRGPMQDAAWSEATVRLHAALVAHGIPATLGGTDEGYSLAITLSGGVDRVDVEIDEFPDGDPRGRAQRQRATRDANLRELGWTVIRVPAWQAYLDPSGVADEVLATAMPAGLGQRHSHT